MAIHRFDAVVIGGGIAGLSAALALARANRTVLLLDGGEKRHAASQYMHNLIGYDGVERTQFYAQAHAGLAAYAHLYHWDMQAEEVVRQDDGFVLRLEGGEQAHARAIILATGLYDVLPDVPGMEALWGRRVLHCLYCHGYEVRERPLGFYGKADHVFDFLKSYLHLSRDITVFFDGDEPGPMVAAQLQMLGVKQHRGIITLLQEQGDGLAMTFEDGSSAEVAALFVRPRTEQYSPLAAQLGCAIDAQGAIGTDAWGRTRVAGIYAAGDAAGQLQQLASAQASGLHAAVALNHDLNERAWKLV